MTTNIEPQYIRLLFLPALTIVFATNSFANYTDTIDVWTVRLNGKPIINSNQNAIMYDYPMVVSLSSFSGNDTLEVCYRTDHGSERQKWTAFLKTPLINFLKGLLTQSTLPWDLKDLNGEKTMFPLE